MPEIAEVARIVHYLRTNLANRRISNIVTQDDPIIYGKVGTSAAEFSTKLKGRTVLDAKQQGKYFWLVMDKPPHPLMHFGMTGWVKMRDVETGYYKPKKKEEKTEKMNSKGENVPEAIDAPAGSHMVEDQEWPPRFYKFVLQMEGEPRCEAAFVDARRLGRIRLIDVPAEEMRNTTPLKENGPDPVVDKKVLTAKWLTEKLHSKKVPVKALMLDQANISGVGNWVADEVLLNAKIHPEQYSNTLSDEQCQQLHKSLLYVCGFACDVLGDSDQYPEEWIFKHRWSKGKKAEQRLPNGQKIVHVTVGGRTSAVVPSVQKKTGPVAGDVNGDVEGEIEGEQSEDAITEEQGKKSKKQKRPNTKANGIVKEGNTKGRTGKRKADAETTDIKHEAETKPGKKSRAEAGAKKTDSKTEDGGRRRSSRLSKA